MKAFARTCLGAAALSLAGCAHQRPAIAPDVPGPHASAEQGSRTVYAPTPNIPPWQTGIATWYGDSFKGKKTSNGERFDPEAMTAAHRKLPFGTWVEVRRVETGTAVRVRINDRGPWGHPERVIDLSYRAAVLLGFDKAGSTKVEIRVVNGPY